jgi:hypothetical protein
VGTRSRRVQVDLMRSIVGFIFLLVTNYLVDIAKKFLSPLARFGL